MTIMLVSYNFHISTVFSQYHNTFTFIVHNKSDNSFEY